MSAASCIPVEVVFAPNWWFQNYGISFEEGFYLDRGQRMRGHSAFDAREIISPSAASSSP